MLLFRGQTLEQEDLLRVTEYFGQSARWGGRPKFFPKGYSRLLPNIMMISNIRENGETIGALPDGEMNFHHDMIHHELPHNGTLLYSLEIPTYGGDTLFASGTAAYDTLDPAIKAKLEGRRALHFYNYGSTLRGKGGIGATAQATHPVFRTHEETGRKAVYVNRLMTQEIEGLPQAGERRAAGGAVRSLREAGVRLSPRLEGRRSAALGQPLLDACARRFPVRPAPADAAHHGAGDRAAVLSGAIGHATDAQKKHQGQPCTAAPEDPMRRGPW